MDRNIINILFYFLLFFAIFIVIIELFFLYILKGKKIIKGNKLRIFGLLMELNKLTVFSLSALIVKFLFIIFMLIYGKSVSTIHLIILILLSAIFGISSFNIKNLIVETLSSFAIYISVYCYKLLCNYLVDVRFEWYVVVGAVLLFVFIALYDCFFFLRNTNYLVSKTRYVRSFRYED